MTQPEGRPGFVTHVIRLGVQLVASCIGTLSFYLIAPLVSGVEPLWSKYEYGAYFSLLFVTGGLLAGSIPSYIIGSRILAGFGKAQKISILMAASAGYLQGAFAPLVLLFFLKVAATIYPLMRRQNPIEFGSDMFWVIMAIYSVFFAVLSAGLSSLAIAICLRLRHNIKRA